MKSNLKGHKILIMPLLFYYRKVLWTSYNIKRSTENCKAIFAGEQRRGMKSYLKGHKILIMPLLFYYRKVLWTSYNIKCSTENCKAIFADEQRRGMKNNLKGHKILIMPLLFLLKKGVNFFAKLVEKRRWVFLDNRLKTM